MNIFSEIVEVFRYSELLKNLILRDIKVRYKRSVLGFIWAMLNPLLMMLVLNVIFSEIFRSSTKNYTAYLITGIVFWNFFSQSTAVAVGSFVSNSNLLKKLYLPKSVFPLSVVCSAMVNLIFSILPLFLIVFISGAQASPHIYMLPIVLFLSLLFVYGLSLCLATFMVFFHDIRQIYDVLLFVLMYATPVFYPAAIVPQQYSIILESNPLTHFIELFRSSIYADIPFSFEKMIYITLSSFVMYFIGVFVYLSLRKRIVYLL